MPGGVQGAAAQPGLDHDGAPGQRPDHTIPDEEAPAGRRPPGRPLTDQHALRGDTRQQVPMAGRIDPVHPAGQHGDGHTVGGQGATVRAAVDAVRAARYDGPATLAQRGGHLGADVRSVGRGGAGSYDRDRTKAAVAQIGFPAQPQRVRSGRAQRVELRGPFRFARADQADAVPVKSGQVHLGGDAGEPVPPGPEGVLQPRGGRAADSAGPLRGRDGRQGCVLRSRTLLPRGRRGKTLARRRGKAPGRPRG